MKVNKLNVWLMKTLIIFNFNYMQSIICASVIVLLEKLHPNVSISNADVDKNGKR